MQNYRIKMLQNRWLMLMMFTHTHTHARARDFFSRPPLPPVEIIFSMQSGMHLSMSHHFRRDRRKCIPYMVITSGGVFWTESSLPATIWNVFEHFRLLCYKRQRRYRRRIVRWQRTAQTVNVRRTESVCVGRT